jgi:hypothetical protein
MQRGGNTGGDEVERVEDVDDARGATEAPEAQVVQPGLAHAGGREVILRAVPGRDGA